MLYDSQVFEKAGNSWQDIDEAESYLEKLDAFDYKFKVGNYYLNKGFWYHAKLDALMAFIRRAQEPVTGEVSLNLYKGNIQVAGRSSPNSLYDAEVASMEGGGSYDQTDAEGFLRLHGLPSRVLGKVRPRKY